MIPKEAFAAIAAVMAVSCAFGYVIRGIIDRDRKDHSRWFYDGLSADHDRWEDDPEPRRCETCRHRSKTLFDDPCMSCSIADSKWEKKH